MRPDLKKCKCSECPYQDLSVPIKSVVYPDSDVLCITNRPNLNECLHGASLVGTSGRFVKKLREKYLPNKTVSVTSLVLCTNKDDESTDAGAIRACLERLNEVIDTCKPKVILGLGAEVTKTLTGKRQKISTLNGSVLKYRNIKFIPCVHPSAAIKPKGDRWFADIVLAFRKANRIVEGTWKPFKVDLDADHCTNPQDCHKALVEIQNRVAQGGCPTPTRIAIDTETDGFRWREGDLLSIGLYDGVKAYALDYSGRSRKHDSAAVAWEAPVQPWPEKTKDLLRQLLLNPDITWVLHNETFDRKWLRYHLQCEPARSIDTMCLALGTTEQGDKVGLDHLAKEYFDVPNYKGVLKPWLKKKDTPYSFVPRGVLAKYLCLDVYWTYKLVDVLHEAVDKEGTRDLCYNLLMPAQKLFSNTEYRGIKHNAKYSAELHEIWEPKVAEARKELSDYAEQFGFKASDAGIKKPKSQKLNPSSPKQLQHFFFECLQLVPLPGSRTTGQEFLDKYPEHPAIRLLTKYRKMKKMLSTYVSGIEKHVWMDGHCHHNTLLFGTVTGRYVIKNPPLQVLPNEGKLKGAFDSLRKQFEPPLPDKQVWCSIDYSQIEVRVAWHYSKDKALGESIMSKDFHTATAARLFQIPFDDVTKLQRSMAKSVSFGIIYGITAKRIAEDWDLEVEYAQGLIDGFFNAYPDFKNWFDSMIQQAFDAHELSTETGRKRRWPLITGRNWHEIRNQAVNFPIQSFASDINLMAMIYLEPELTARGWGYPMFAVHDSIEFILNKDTLHESIPFIRNVMENPAIESCARFKVDVEIGPNWGELTKYECK